jgi:hypothetical protein
MNRSASALLALAALVLAECATGPDPTIRYAGRWGGMWRSTTMAPAEGTIEAELRSVGGGLDGSVVFLSSLGRFTLPIRQVAVQATGPVAVSGVAAAESGAMQAKVAVVFESDGNRISGQYEFPALRDAGTFELQRK